MVGICSTHVFGILKTVANAIATVTIVMDHYIHGLESRMGDGFSMELGSMGIDMQIRNHIVLNQTLRDNCPGLDEFVNLVTKRLENKSGRSRVARLGDVAVGCLLSCGYQINHQSVRDITYRDMITVWSFIETSSVSSSEVLAPWLKLCKGNRSMRGFEGFCDGNSMRVEMDEPPRETGVPRVRRPQGSTVQLAVSPACALFGPSDTVSSAIQSDLRLFMAMRATTGTSVVPAISPFSVTTRAPATE